MNQAIVNYFPCLKSEDEGVSEYFAFYHPTAGGFLDNRLKKIRLMLPMENRKRKPKKKESGSSKRIVRPPGFLRDFTIKTPTEAELEGIIYEVRKP
jgi:hypothetical protein